MLSYFLFVEECTQANFPPSHIRVSNLPMTDSPKVRLKSGRQASVSYEHLIIPIGSISGNLHMPTQSLQNKVQIQRQRRAWFNQTPKHYEDQTHSTCVKQNTRDWRKGRDNTNTLFLSLLSPLPPFFLLFFFVFLLTQLQVSQVRLPLGWASSVMWACVCSSHRGWRVRVCKRGMDK